MRCINVDATVRARPTVDVGTKQLKLQNRTKRRMDWAQAKQCGLKGVKKRLGAYIQKIWKEVQANKDSHAKKLAKGDEILKMRVFKLKCSNVECQAIVDVGGPRLAKIRKSKEPGANLCSENLFINLLLRKTMTESSTT